MKKTSIFLVIILMAVTIIAQEIGTYNVNQLDSAGRKNGIWFNEYWDVQWYHNGQLHGSCIGFIDNQSDSTIKQVWCIYNYKDNELSGQQIIFNRNGTIGKIYASVTPNIDFIGKARFYVGNLPYQSYTYVFDEIGRLISEGWSVLGDDPMIDWERVGIWKYFKADGDIDIVDFSEGKHNPF